MAEITNINEYRLQREQDAMIGKIEHKNSGNTASNSIKKETRDDIAKRKEREKRKQDNARLIASLGLRKHKGPVDSGGTGGNSNTFS